MFYYKIHKSCGKTLLAACDSELLGKTFEEGRRVLCISRDFYGGKKIGNGIVGLFPKADIINISGSKIVSIALKNKWISGKGIIKIGKVPHAQIFVL